jgi:hypothetical protein
LEHKGTTPSLKEVVLAIITLVPSGYSSQYSRPKSEALKLLALAAGPVQENYFLEMRERVKRRGEEKGKRAGRFRLERKVKSLCQKETLPPRVRLTKKK